MPRMVVLLAAFIAIAGCTSSPDLGPRFDDEGQAAITCMKHQPHAPGPRYTDEQLRRTDETLTFLRYYTAHGDKAYCDNEGPTETDRAWAELYVKLGADKTNVAALLR